jgi:hypothetical protein
MNESGSLLPLISNIQPSYMLRMIQNSGAYPLRLVLLQPLPLMKRDSCPTTAPLQRNIRTTVMPLLELKRIYHWLYDTSSDKHLFTG